MRLTDIDAQKERLNRLQLQSEDLKGAIELFLETSETVDAELIKHGRWIKNDDRSGWHCSVCKIDDFYAYVRDYDTGENKLQDYYCPNCGAKMDLKERSEE